MSSPAPTASTAALITLLLVMFLSLLGVGVVIPLLPFYGQAFHAPPWQIALIFSAYSLGAFFGEPFWGRLSDRIGRKPVLASTVAAGSLCFFCLAFAPGVWTAIGIRFLGGLAGGNASVIQGYIADVTPPEQRAGRMALLGTAFNAGFIVGPALGGLLAHPEAGAEGFQAPLFVAAALGACSVAGILAFLKESRAPRPVAGAQSNRWAMLGQAVDHPVIRRLLLVTFVAGFGFTGVEATFGLWSQARFAWGPHQVGLCFGVIGLVAALTQGLLVGRVSKRFGEVRVLAAGMALSLVCCLLQPLSTGAPTVIALLALTTIGQSVAYPNVAALISRVTSPDHQGQMLGLNNAGGSMARVLGPMCAGLAFSGVSIDGPFWLAALVMLPAIVLTLSAGRAVKRLA